MLMGVGAALLVLVLVWALVAGGGQGHAGDGGHHEIGSLSNQAFVIPSAAELWDVLRLEDYNTRLVVSSTAVLGLAAGLIGSFLLLRKQSLMGDALSHATLPGIALAFVIMVLWGGAGKNLAGLLAGASLFGVIGVLSVLIIRTQSRLKSDTAMGIVLSVFFGLGIAMLGLIQQMPEASAAGLENYIYGKAASVTMQDFKLILTATIIALAACLLLQKELTLLCFDEGYAKSQGWPVTKLDIAILVLVTGVTVIGLQAVGLILIIAFLIIPPAAARFWTEKLHVMFLLSGIIGALSGWFGAVMSALQPKLPAGAIIVIVAAFLFIISMVFGSARGVLPREIERMKLNRKVGMQNLLRAIFENLELQTLAKQQGQAVEDVAAKFNGNGHGNGKHLPQLDVDAKIAERTASVDDLLQVRSWSAHTLRRLVARARQAGLVRLGTDDQCTLTEQGFYEAARVTRNHRLWEIYLITHADIAPSHVDRDADQIEHVLPVELIRKLETLLARRQSDGDVPPSPHAISPKA